jgi:hypothetical protein
LPDVPALTPNCSLLKCEKKFELPIKFIDSTLEIDLGRTVLLKFLNLQLDPIFLPENFTFPNFTLQILNTSDSNNFSTPCSFLNRVNFMLKFNCGKKLGRILTANIIFSSIGNDLNITASGNRLTTPNYSPGVANLFSVRAK